MPKLDSVLATAAQQLLSAGIASNTLDAEILLSYVLAQNRSWLRAHSTDEISKEQVDKFQGFVERRLHREPIAYITGVKEFYGREFAVTPETLIPRPETEDLIELTLNNAGKKSQAVLDAGCGSGCIGITLKLERPEWKITLADISSDALKVAEKNATNLHAKIELRESDLLTVFENSGEKFDIIVANLPYVNQSWEISPETAFEPQLALYADNNGLALIKKLIEQTPEVLRPHGLLLLEADPEQHAGIAETASRHGFKQLETKGYALSFELQA